jgi:hypothetical protein
MLTRLIQRTDRDVPNAIEYEYEYRDAEYEESESDAGPNKRMNRSRFGLAECRSQLRNQPNSRPGYPGRYPYFHWRILWTKPSAVRT